MYKSRFSLIPYILTIVVLGFAFYYCSDKYEVLRDSKLEIQSNATLAQALSAQIKETEDDYSSTHDAASDEAQKKENEMENIFPAEEAMTDLARIFDDFFVANNYSTNRLFLSNATFGRFKSKDEIDYGILPVRMSIESSKDNFFKFLNWVESSGSSENKLRMMAIKNININFNKGDLTNNVLKYSVELEAYYKKPLEKENTK